MNWDSFLTRRWNVVITVAQGLPTFGFVCYGLATPFGGTALTATLSVRNSATPRMPTNGDDHKPGKYPPTANANTGCAGER